MSFLYQIEAKQKQLKQYYAQLHAVRKPTITIVPPPIVTAETSAEKILKVKKPLERKVAVALPADLHEQAENLMKILQYPGSKRDFIKEVLQASFAVLTPQIEIINLG
jgi:hypothetical protein